METPRHCDLTAFPPSLFPTHYTMGPTTDHRGTPGTWPLLGPVQRQDTWVNEDHPTTCPLDEVQKPRWVSQRRHGVGWEPVEPVALPFLPPNEVCAIPDLTFKDDQSEGIAGQAKCEAYLAKSYCFIEQMKSFFSDHHRDAFLSMGKLLEPCFTFSKAKPKAGEQVAAGRMLSDRKFALNRERFARLLGDALWEVPHDVLAGCLREELQERRARERFDAACTGGCLHYLPPLGARKHGILVHPSGSTMDTLSFQTIAQKCKGKVCRPDCIKTQKRSVKFHLTGGIRQISTSSVRQEVFVGVRSDYFCGLWTAAGEQRIQPKCIEVVQLEEPATCLAISPHIPGELLVASESGAVYLWVAQKSLQCVRREAANLHFDAESRWRWCHFTAHPRVITFADRTGVDATDARCGKAGNVSLFRIGEAARCQKGERVVLSQHLYPVNPFHFLVTTQGCVTDGLTCACLALRLCHLQYSAYLMDERLPILPVLSWSHGLSGPPTFVHATHGPDGGGAATGGPHQHLLLGTQRTRELLLLSYAGGGVEACHSTSLPRKLACASEWLDHVRPLKPRQRHLLRQRLESAGAGVTSIAHEGGCGQLTVLQLSAAGDVFYQTLRRPGHSAATDARVTEPPAVTLDTAAGDPADPAVPPLDPPTPAVPPEIVPPSTRSTGTLGSEVNGTGLAGAEGEADGQVVGAADLLGEEEKRCRRWASGFLRQRGAASKPPSPQAGQRRARRFRRRFLRLQRGVPQEPPVVESAVVSRARAALRAGATGVTEATAGRGSGEEERSEEARAEPLPRLLLPVLPLPRGEKPVPFPEPVADERAKDELSSRLTAAWQGGWYEWWEEKQGIASKRRAQEARRHRRAEKARGRHHRRLRGSYASSASEWAPDLDETLSCSGMSFTSESNYLDSDRGASVTSGNFFSQSSEPNEVEPDDDILRGRLSVGTRASNVKDIDVSRGALFGDDAPAAASDARRFSSVSSSQNLPSSILKKNPSKAARPSLAEAATQDDGELWTDILGENLSQASQTSTPFLSRSRRPVQPSEPQGSSQKPPPSHGPLQRQPSSSQPSGGLPVLRGSAAAFYSHSQGGSAAGESPSASLAQMSSSQPVPSLAKKKKRFKMGF